MRAGRRVGEHPRMDWTQLATFAALAWIAVALVVATLVGHGAALGSPGE